jgi:hypothetical protein
VTSRSASPSCSRPKKKSKAKNPEREFQREAPGASSEELRRLVKNLVRSMLSKHTYEMLQEQWEAEAGTSSKWRRIETVFTNLKQADVNAAVDIEVCRRVVCSARPDVS